MSAALSISDLIAKFIEVHGEKYDYSKVTLEDRRTGKICVKCPFHGEFRTNHLEHKNGHGCKQCGYKKNKITRSKIFIEDLDDLTNKCIENFGDIIDFSTAIYINGSSRLALTCKVHNIKFCNTAYHVVRGAGCRECRREKIHRAADVRRLGQAEFIKRSESKHGKLYDYSKSEYKSLTDPIKIICHEHGLFLQKPREHFRGSGCQLCAETSISVVGYEWLQSLNKKNILPEYRINFDNKWYFVDGYDPTTNTVYEFYGDYWHGNPKTTDHNATNQQASKTFGELYRNTMIREANIKSLGYNYISIWESEYVRNII